MDGRPGRCAAAHLGGGGSVMGSVELDGSWVECVDEFECE